MTDDEDTTAALTAAVVVVVGSVSIATGEPDFDDSTEELGLELSAEAEGLATSMMDPGVAVSAELEVTTGTAGLGLLAEPSAMADRAASKMASTSANTDVESTAESGPIEAFTSEDSPTGILDETGALVLSVSSSVLTEAALALLLVVSGGMEGNCGPISTWDETVSTVSLRCFSFLCLDDLDFGSEEEGAGDDSLFASASCLKYQQAN